MKRLVIIVVLLLLGDVTYAQESTVATAAKVYFWNRVHFGIKGGFTATNVNIDVRDTNFEDYDLPTAEKFNWRVGFDARIDAFDNFFIHTGLEYINKGFNVDLDRLKQKYNNIKSIQGQWTTLYRYIQLPLDFGYDLGSFQLMAGPYFSYGLGGTEMYDLDIELNDGTTNSISQTNDLQAISGGTVNSDLPDDITGMVPDYFRSFDFGLTFGVGYKIGKLNINLQYEQGFTNITPDFSQEPNFDPNNLQLKHNVLSVNLTYWFK